MLSAGSTPKIQGLTVEQAEAVVRLSCLPVFKDLIAKVQADEVIVLHAFPVRNVVCEQLTRVWKPTVLTVCLCQTLKVCSASGARAWAACPVPYMPGSCSVLTLPCCLCSSLAFGWTVVHQSRRCHTYGVRKHLQVSQIQAPAILSLNLNINLGVMFPKRSHQ